ncbi:MAG: hypothetical protein ACSHX3_11875 [Litorimonas sp.]
MLVTIVDAVAQSAVDTNHGCELWLEAQAISETQEKITYIVVGNTPEHSNEMLRRGFGHLLLTVELEAGENDTSLADLKSYGADESWPIATIFFFANGRPFEGYSFQDATERVADVVSFFVESRHEAPIQNEELLASQERLRVLNTRMLCNFHQLEVVMFKQIANKRLLEILEGNENIPNEEALSKLRQLSAIPLDTGEEGLIEALKENEASLKLQASEMRED